MVIVNLSKALFRRIAHLWLVKQAPDCFRIGFPCLKMLPDAIL